MQNPSDPAGQLDLNPDLNLGIELQDDLEGDTLREECGVFGIFGHPEAAAVTALGLHALQHRGQEAAGIVSFDGSRFHSEKRLGLVGDTFSRREVIERLPGNLAVGHVRYSTTGGNILRNVQPLFAELDGGGFAVGLNGNLTNGLTLRKRLVHEGALILKFWFHLSKDHQKKRLKSLEKNALTRWRVIRASNPRAIHTTRESSRPRRTMRPSSTP